MPKHGENIWKRKDGRWEARYIKGRDSSGKAIYGSAYAKTYSEVRRKRDVLLRELQSIDVVVQKSNPEKSIEMVTKEFLDLHKFEIKMSTYVRYIEIAENYIIPIIGTINIASFTQENGNEFIKYLLTSGRKDGQGLAPKTVKDIIAVLKLILKYSEDHHYISAVPLTLTVPKQGKNQIQILTPSQCKKLEAYSCTTSDPFKFGVYLCLYTGLRIGELCALQWNDVDLTNSIISIRRTVLRVKNVNGDGYPKTKIIIGTPKTPSSERLIPIPNALNVLLQALKTASLASDDYYVLTGTNMYIEPRNYYSKYKHYLQLCGLDDFTFHALRHTFATRCVEAGTDPKILSEVLGHASVRITLDRYVHPSMASKRKSLERLFAPYTGNDTGQNNPLVIDCSEK